MAWSTQLWRTISCGIRAKYSRCGMRVRIGFGARFSGNLALCDKH